jgi:8-oxo-dGTP pyrophosphatase MutT (NUDIX family)
MTDYLIVAAVAIRERRLLMVEDTHEEEGRPLWGLPSGVAEGQELVLETLKREVREETGLTITGMGGLDTWRNSTACQRMLAGPSLLCVSRSMVCWHRTTLTSPFFRPHG